MYLYHSEEHLFNIRKHKNDYSPHPCGNLTNEPIAVFCRRI